MSVNAFTNVNINKYNHIASVIPYIPCKMICIYKCMMCINQKSSLLSPRLELKAPLPQSHDCSSVNQTTGRHTQAHLQLHARTHIHTRDLQRTSRRQGEKPPTSLSSSVRVFHRAKCPVRPKLCPPMAKTTTTSLRTTGPTSFPIGRTQYAASAPTGKPLPLPSAGRLYKEPPALTELHSMHLRENIQISSFHPCIPNALGAQLSDHGCAMPRYSGALPEPDMAFPR